MVITSNISLKTVGNADTHDITEAVARAVAESGLTSGTVTIFCPGSTSGVTTIEYEEGAVADLQQVFDEVVPPSRYYRHNERWGDGNGHSHVRAALPGTIALRPIRRPSSDVGDMAADSLRGLR